MSTMNMNDSTRKTAHKGGIQKRIVKPKQKSNDDALAKENAMRRAKKRNEMLISAAADGDVGVVRVLLGMGPGATDSSAKDTAMQEATSRGRTRSKTRARNKVAPVLIEAGA